MPSKADLLLHPVRMQIVIEISGTHRTAQEIARALPDVPQATLYRHLNTLLEGGILEVVEERPIRGTVEKVYAVNLAATRLDKPDLSHLTAEERLQHFTMMVGSLITDYSRYLKSTTSAEGDLLKTAFSKIAVYLSEEEHLAMLEAQHDLLKTVVHNPAGEGRQRYIFSLISLPMPEDETS